jgi:glycine cleavage system H lipoate-binding protein
MNANGTRLLPDGALPCVWMRAGLVAYKLCRRDYECEGCPFDAALRGVEPEAHEDVEPPRYTFPPDRRYHRGHGWIRATGPRRLRFGIDAFAARLLDRLSAVVLPAPGSRIRRGRPACWVTDDDVPLPLVSPVSGTVLAVNSTLRQDPRELLASPYERGWLLELRCHESALQREDLVGGDEQHRRAGERLAALLRREHGTDAVGPTLADGGEPLHDLRRRIGAARYHRVIGRLLR